MEKIVGSMSILTFIFSNESERKLELEPTVDMDFEFFYNFFFLTLSKSEISNERMEQMVSGMLEDLMTSSKLGT